MLLRSSMEAIEIISALGDLIHLDIDAVHAYSHAIERIDVQEVKNQLAEFRADHERHVDLLSKLIQQLGGEPPELKRDLKSYVIQGVTALRSVTGAAGALKALRTDEELTNKTYDKMLTLGFPTEIEAVIQGCRDDERRHLHYISKRVHSQAA